MPFDWKNVTQQQLAGLPTVGTGMQQLQNMPQQKQLLTGNNPNPKFPRARNAWEHVKRGGGEFLFGHPEGVEQYSTVTPQQQGIMQLLQQLGVYNLQNPYEGFEPIAEQALDQFNQEGINSIAHRFTSLGQGSLDSPDFAQHAYGARAGLMKDLAAQKAQWGQQNMGNILQMLQLGLGRQTENIHRPEQPGFAKEAAMAAIKALMAGG
jgi:hypothetical protein